MLNDFRDTYGFGMPEIFPYCSEARAIFDAMPTKPDSTRKGLINDLVKGLIDDGIWAKLDILYLTAAHASDSSLLNWINPGVHDCTVVNLVAGQFTIDRGWTGNGVNGFLNSNYNPAIDAINYALNDASIGAYCRLNIQEDGIIIGLSGVPNGIYIYPRYLSIANRFLAKLNDDTFSSIANLNSQGFYIASRDVAAHKDVYKNAVKTEQIELSTAIENGNLYILVGNNIIGGETEWSTNQVAAAFAGGGMTQTNVNNFTDRLETFLDSIGAGVIP